MRTETHRVTISIPSHPPITCDVECTFKAFNIVDDMGVPERIEDMSIKTVTVLTPVSLDLMMDSGDLIYVLIRKELQEKGVKTKSLASEHY